MNDSWDEAKYALTDVDVTVYIAVAGASKSQTLLGASYTSTVTPEPATLALFGLGLAGLAVSRRWKK